MPRGRRKSYRRPRRISPLIALILGLLFLLRYFSGQPLAPPAPLAEGFHTVVRVVDGDTLLLADDSRVRLIGADTPETVKPDHPVEKWGPEATAFTRFFVAGGRVRLQFDRERVDRYGRYLAYVWVGEKMLNEELIRSGLARASLGFNYSSAMKRRFKAAQEEAKMAGRGIWSSEPGGYNGSLNRTPKTLTSSIFVSSYTLPLWFCSPIFALPSNKLPSTNYGRS